MDHERPSDSCRLRPRPPRLPRRRGRRPAAVHGRRPEGRGPQRRRRGQGRRGGRRASSAPAAAQKKKGSKRERVDDLRFGTPGPGPGGRRKEYWIEARPVRWNVAPTGRDEWMGKRVPRRRTLHRVRLPAVHGGLRRADGQAAHARADPARRGRRRDRGQLPQRRRQEVRPGRDDAPARRALHARLRRRPTSATSPASAASWSRARSSPTPGRPRPDSVGVWPYHDHGPNHTLNSLRGLFGAIVISPKGAKPPGRGDACTSCTASRPR